MWLHPQGTAASTKNKLPSLITSMETVGAKALEDFADNIKVPFLCPRHPGRPAGLQAGPLPTVSGTPESRPPSGVGLPCGEAGQPCCWSPVSTHGPPFLSQRPPPEASSSFRSLLLFSLCPMGCPDACLPGGGAVGPQTGAGWAGASLGAVPGTQAVCPTERPGQGIQHAQGWHRARAHEQRRCCRGLLGRAKGAGGRMGGRR